MSDTVFSAFTDSGPVVVKDALPIPVDFVGGEVVFDSGFDLSDPKKLPAEGGIYLAKLVANWSGWTGDLPTEGFASAQLVHVAGETESVIVTHEVNSLHTSDGFGDIGFNVGGFSKMGLATVEGGGYFELRAQQNADDEDLRLLTEFVLVKL